MSFEKIIRIPKDRVGALIGKSGKIKSKIENSCSVKLEINSDNGEIEISSNIDDEKFLYLILILYLWDQQILKVDQR